MGLYVVLLGCGSDADHQRREEPGRDSFENIFEPVGTVSFSEPETALITSILSVARRRDGLYAIPDRQESQVRIYLPTGELYANLGRKGEGPGEFRAPSDVAFTTDGSLHVIEIGSPRVTRFGPTLVFDTTFLVQTTVLGPMRPFDDRLVLGRLDFYAPPEFGFYGVYRADGTVDESFHQPPRSLYEEPYWMSALGFEPGETFRLAISGAHAVVANPVLYELSVYPLDGGLPRRFGKTPQSWVHLTPVEAGHFTGGPVSAFNSWVDAASRIDGVEVYRDSVVLVAHRTPRTASGERERRLDAYLMDGTKIFSDLAIPGCLVMSDSAVAFLTQEAPYPWTLELFRLRTEPN